MRRYRRRDVRAGMRGRGWVPHAPHNGLRETLRVGCAASVARALLASEPTDFAPLSSRGLGRRPLMAETRVRIPVAVLLALRVDGAFCVWRRSASCRPP